MSRWAVPVEVAVALASPIWQAHVDRRRALGDHLQPEAVVFIRAGRLFALISFARAGSLDLQFEIKAALWENANETARP